MVMVAIKCKLCGNYRTNGLTYDTKFICTTCASNIFSLIKRLSGW
jgi:hypothetical protein